MTKQQIHNDRFELSTFHLLPNLEKLPDGQTKEVVINVDEYFEEIPSKKNLEMENS